MNHAKGGVDVEYVYIRLTLKVVRILSIMHSITSSIVSLKLNFDAPQVN